MKRLAALTAIILVCVLAGLLTAAAQLRDLNGRSPDLPWEVVEVGDPPGGDDESDDEAGDGSAGTCCCEGPSGPLDLYVDGVNGDDANDGLSQDNAKKTIHGGLNAIPEVLNGNVTVHVADATYPEDFALITARGRRGPYLIDLVGNTAHPENVILDGTNATGEIGIAVSDLYVSVRGLTFSHYADSGITVVAGGRLDLSRCRFVDNDQAYAAIDVNGGSAEIEDCEILRNSTGVRARGGGLVRFFNDVGTVMDLNDVGLLAETNSAIEMRSPCTITNSPLVVYDQSTIKGYGACLRDGASTCSEVDPPAWCANGP